MPYTTLVIILAVFVLAFALYAFYLFKTRKKRRLKRQKQKIKDKINALSHGASELTPEEFFELRKKSFGGKGSPQFSKKYGFSGVYILYNSTKNKYYVGQGKNVLSRVNMHFTGKGNGDVYADYKYGDKFTIKMIGLKHSGYRSLNELERNTIAVYNARATGYNKTAGNKN